MLSNNMGRLRLKRVSYEQTVCLCTAEIMDKREAWHDTRFHVDSEKTDRTKPHTKRVKT